MHYIALHHLRQRVPFENETLKVVWYRPWEPSPYRLVYTDMITECIPWQTILFSSFTHWMARCPGQGSQNYWQHGHFLIWSRLHFCSQSLPSIPTWALPAHDCMSFPLVRCKRFPPSVTFNWRFLPTERTSSASTAFSISFSSSFFFIILISFILPCLTIWLSERQFVNLSKTSGF